MKKTIAIIGGGPAGLMAADVLSDSDVKITVYDAMPSFGRKFLMAGKSGLNLTHSEPYQQFITRFGSREKEIKKYLDYFKPAELLEWTKALKIETFVGTSGRVFPKTMKASPLLRAWLQKLQMKGVNFCTRHYWSGWEEDQQLVFDTPGGMVKIKADATILALGGASWPKLGSNGEWIFLLKKRGLDITPFRPANCGFIVQWSQHFSEKFHGQPIKSVTLSCNNFEQRGEFVVTKTGVEGSLVYAASAQLRDELASNGHAIMTLDLVPDLSLEKLIKRLKRPRGSQSMSNFIKKTIGLEGVKLGLLYEFAKADFADTLTLAAKVKALPIPLSSPNSIDSAISCAGGLSLEEVDDRLMLRKIPGVFCAGEMLDWEAPTGGYLLNACFALGRAAGRGVLAWLDEQNFLR